MVMGLRSAAVRISSIAGVAIARGRRLQQIFSPKGMRGLIYSRGGTINHGPGMGMDMFSACMQCCKSFF